MAYLPNSRVKQELHPVAAALAMMPIAQLLSVYKAAEIGVDPDNRMVSMPAKLN